MPIANWTMISAVLGACISVGFFVWNADPIADPVQLVLVVILLALAVAPYVVAHFFAREVSGPVWTQVLLLVAVLVATALSIYGNWAFAAATGMAKDPLMLAAVILYQFMVIGAALMMTQIFAR